MRMIGFKYLTKEQLIETNKQVLKEIKVKKADSHQVLRDDMIDKALSDCKDTEGGVYEKAAALLVSVIRYHPFASGVRRTAYTATMVFLEANGERPRLDFDAGVLQGIRERFYTSDEIVAWLRGNEIRKFKRFQ